MTMNFKYTVLGAGLIGGAMLVAGAMPASATSLVPAVIQTSENTSVQEVSHYHRPGDRRYSPSYGGLGFHFGLTPYGPTASFGLGAPYGHRSYGLNIGPSHRGLVHGQYRRSGGGPAISPRYGRIDR